METERRRIRLHNCIVLLPVLCAMAAAYPQAPLAATDTGPYRFLAAHGRRAAIFGYAGRGLEIWGYPFQILDRYTVNFQPQGSPEVIEGANLLTRIWVAPDQVVRVWTGPDFKVIETLFVPLDEPGAIASYQVTGASPVDIVVTWQPELNLMWPASAGGQDVQWSDDAHSYLMSESTYGYKAVLQSPEIEAHQPIVNSARREALTQTFTLHPKLRLGAESTALVYVALVSPGGDAQAAAKQLAEHAATLTQDLGDDLRKWKANALSITTPDEEVNRALNWADTDLDQAWACDAKIGCGAVAGFGPSRPMRRPQYDWFFAGDGMIAAEAMLAGGHDSRAREELEFIFWYQNVTDGMIWHEISQSAGFLDWAGKYPYLFAHVDLTFQFLSTLGRYYATTNDLEFLKSHWSAIHNAFHFCQSLVSPQTDLPLIPSGKMGANEQDRMLDDAGLSASWVAAAESYAQLARATGHAEEAESVTRMGVRARTAFALRYWNTAERFWISGYTVSGRAMTVRRSGPAEALTEHLLLPMQESEMLDALTGAAFQTDWGTRSVAADSPDYDAYSYSKGSVSALHSAGIAAAFWSAHRPLSAWQIWSGLISWATMDSPGYMDEVLTGEIFQPQVESVPQQTWSSAGLLSSTIHGMLGVAVDAPANHLTLAPHRFPGGGTVKVEHLRASGALVFASFRWSGQSIDVSLTNDGRPVRLELAPEIPLGVSQVRVEVNGRRTAAVINSWEEEQQARIEFVLPHGTTQCRFQYSGGVWIEIPRAQPQPGANSRELRIRKVTLQGMDLAIQADIRAGAKSSLILETPWQIAAVEGASATVRSSTRTEIQFAPATAQGESERYVTTTLRIRFQGRYRQLSKHAPIAAKAKANIQPDNQ